MFQPTKRDQLVTARSDAFLAYEATPFSDPMYEPRLNAYREAREAVREYDREQFRLAQVNQDVPEEWGARDAIEPAPWQTPEPTQERPADADAPGGRP